MGIGRIAMTELLKTFGIGIICIVLCVVGAFVPFTQAIAADAAPADQISEFRLKHGEVRVTRDATLDRIAADQAREMAEKDNLSHEILGPFGRRIAPSMAGRAAENIAYGYDVFDKTLTQWINSPDHLKNLLLHNATRVGIASAKTANGKRTYWAMEIAGDYETKPVKEKTGKKGAAVAQAKPDRPASAAAKPAAKKDCHLNLKWIGLCI
jgi:Cysteine-rich secretory protein family